MSELRPYTRGEAAKNAVTKRLQYEFGGAVLAIALFAWIGWPVLAVAVVAWVGLLYYRRRKNFE